MACVDAGIQRRARPAAAVGDGRGARAPRPRRAPRGAARAHAGRSSSVDTCAILLLDEETDELVARAALGIEEEVEQGVRIPVGGGFAGRIAADRRPVVLDDVDHADVLNPILREKGIKSMFGVPLIVEGQVLGVMHVGSLTPRAFRDDEVELLQLAADRAAIAIEHARLYEAERAARERIENVAGSHRRRPRTPRGRRAPRGAPAADPRHPRRRHLRGAAARRRRRTSSSRAPRSGSRRRSSRASASRSAAASPAASPPSSGRW